MHFDRADGGWHIPQMGLGGNNAASLEDSITAACAAVDAMYDNITWEELCGDTI
jgi:hypothetical protein